MMQPLHILTAKELAATTSKTLDEYQQDAAQFWEGTRHHDVSQNIDALLRNIRSEPPFKLLDFGCGPGRDLLYPSQLGHHPIGVDGCQAFVEMAKKQTGCDVWHQDFLNLHLPDGLRLTGFLPMHRCFMCQHRNFIASCNSSMPA